MPEYQLSVIASDRLSAAAQAEIIALCNRAYGRDMATYFESMPGPTHVIASLDGAVVSHAMWVTRWLQPGTQPLLRTAYVEMVATDPAHGRRGYARAVLQRLAESVTHFDLAALCPSDQGVGLYNGLGWHFWLGPLFVRREDHLFPTPAERVMVLRLPKTPALDLDAPLSVEWREGELW